MIGWVPSITLFVWRESEVNVTMRDSRSARQTRGMCGEGSGLPEATVGVRNWKDLLKMDHRTSVDRLFIISHIG